MTHSLTFTLKLPEHEKNAAFAVFEELGVSPDVAIQGFIQYVIEHKALPFPVSEEALKAIQAKPTTKAKKGDIFEYVRTKSPTQQRCFSTAQEADEFISQLRDNWEKQ
jgi:addiction module RelB/DinJ family antitoxin